MRGAYHAYLTVVGSLLGLALHGDPDTYRYIPESIRNYPGAKAVASMMTHFGFIDVRVIPVLGGLMAIHVARKPALPKTSYRSSQGSSELTRNSRRSSSLS